MKTLYTYLIKSISALLPGLVPPIHILLSYKFWTKFPRRVDKRYCSCSCWDTVFKGSYENGIGSYKHMYFNATANTTKMWIWTVGCIIVLYECFKYELKLFSTFQLRYPMAILFLSSIFSHYYAWWIYINYWNDDFYYQWNHQLFFTVTEVISTYMVLHLSDVKNSITFRKAFLIVAIALVHLIAGGFDQFVQNIIYGEGWVHQVMRDLGFVVPDFFNIIIPIYMFFKNQQQKTVTVLQKLKKDIFCIMVLIPVGVIISAML